MDRGVRVQRNGYRKRKGRGGADFQAAAQILRDTPHTWDTRSFAIRYGGWGPVVRNSHVRDGTSIRPLLPQAHVDLMCLRMLGSIGRGFADNLQECCGDTCILGQCTLDIDLHAHQAEGVDDIAQLLRRLAGTATAQIGGD